MYGVQSSVATLQRVAVRRPDAMLRADHVRWHYAHPLDAERVLAQHDRFVDLLEAHGCDVVWMPDDADDLADSVFTYDPSFVVGSGAVVLRPGKELRRGEADLHAAFYGEHGIPVLGRIIAPGTVEGGDCFFLDEHTLAVGRGFRTNQVGIDQLSSILGPVGVDVIVYDLPFHQGPEACLHLLSLISPLADDLALVHAPLLPTALHQALTARGVTLLAAPAVEFTASGGLNLNVLATAPRRLISVEGFPATLALLRSAGCEVDTFPGDELCVACEGGPTCLTRPLLRA